jgi:coenzyme F420-reducing hydrogenase delta subunit
MSEPLSAVPRGTSGVRALPAATVFVCANCSRAGRVPTSGGRPPPDVPDLRWPASFRQVLLPCAGRLQPEHVLKAFESGADVVCVIGCQEDNCHYLQGSSRCARRVDHVRSLLQEIGLGRERLLFFALPGAAAEDTALGAGEPAPATPPPIVEALLAAVHDQVLAAVEEIAPSPLRPVTAGEPASPPAGIGSQR